MKNKSILNPILIFFFTLFVCLIIFIPAIRNRMVTDRIRLEQLITDKGAKISESIATPINQIYTVASYIQRHNGDISNFDDFAEAIVDNNYVRNLIIAPNGVVSHIYPDNEENRQVIGLDYYSDSSEGNREAVIAAQKNQMLLAGPFVTVVGDLSISGRLPVYLTNSDGQKEFWGIISITLFFPDVLEGTNLDSLKNQDLIYELWRDNVDTGERQVILSNGIIDESTGHLDKSIPLINTEWYLRLAPVREWYHYTETWIYSFAALLISVMLSLLVQKNQTLKLIWKKEEHMANYDSLTNLLNRQGLYSKLNELIQKNKKFIIYYIDLNRFKEINDEYGHTGGDFVLAEFSRRILKCTDSNHIVARIGGDEFVVAYITETLSTHEMDEFWEKVYKELEQPMIYKDNQHIYLKFSKGVAKFLNNSDSIDSVISMADEEMYKEKKG